MSILVRFWPNRYQSIALDVTCRLVPVWSKSDRYEHSYRPFKVTMLTTNIWTLPKKQQSLYTTFLISHLYYHLILGIKTNEVGFPT